MPGTPESVSEPCPFREAPSWKKVELFRPDTHEGLKKTRTVFRTENRVGPATSGPFHQRRRRPGRPCPGRDRGSVTGGRPLYVPVSGVEPPGRGFHVETAPGKTKNP